MSLKNRIKRALDSFAVAWIIAALAYVAFWPVVICVVAGAFYIISKVW